MVLSVTGNFIRLVGTTQSILPAEATLTKSVNETEKKVFHVFELFKRLKLSGEPETKTDISSECAIPRLIESPHISACGSDM